LNGRELNGRAVFVRHDATHNIYVGNLSWALTSDDLYELFQGFRPVGCKIFMNTSGRSRGFGIVKFTSEEDATRAVAALHMAEVSGRNIEVSAFSLLDSSFAAPLFPTNT
jgi:RNA recognition motif-containing protein